MLNRHTACSDGVKGKRKILPTRFGRCVKYTFFLTEVLDNYSQPVKMKLDSFLRLVIFYGLIRSQD